MREAMRFPEEDSDRTLVLGLGSLIQSDDGVGVYAQQQLEAKLQGSAQVEFLEGGTKGLELLPYLLGVRRLLVLDAVDVGAVAGAVIRVAGEELCSLPGSGSAHEMALPDLLTALRMLGQEPPEVVLLGIQPATTELGAELSPVVARALPLLVEAAWIELARWAAVIPITRGRGTEAVPAPDDVLGDRRADDVFCDRKADNVFCDREAVDVLGDRRAVDMN
ncbi:MAG: hydrogenase maturation protease [Acidobacteriia bacterium]|nr:hydrogenase maturation protease [Terriglobia bacterium]